MRRGEEREGPGLASACQSSRAARETEDGGRRAGAFKGASPIKISTATETEGSAETMTAAKFHFRVALNCLIKVILLVATLCLIV